MSGECDDCGEHTLDCFCRARSAYVLGRACGKGCPCQFKDTYTHLNLIRNDMKKPRNYKKLNAKPIPLGDGENPPAELPPVKYINVRGREEHEAVIKDAEWCKELGLDQMYEVMVYLKRWGNWLGKY